MNKNIERKPMLIQHDPAHNQWFTTVNGIGQAMVLQIQRMPHISQVTQVEHQSYLVKFFRAFTTNKQDVINTGLLFLSTVYDVPLMFCEYRQNEDGSIWFFVSENFK